NLAPLILLNGAARANPLAPDGRQAVAHVALHFGVTPRPRCVVDAHRLVLLDLCTGQSRRLQRNFAEGYAHALSLPFGVDPARVRQTHVRALPLDTLAAAVPVNTCVVSGNTSVSAAHARFAFRGPSASRPANVKSRPRKSKGGLSQTSLRRY